MASNIDFDQNLLDEVQRLGKFKYKKDAINAALQEYAARHKQVEILELFGTIDYFAGYDYKVGRKKR